jgi:hypothetical protein
MTKSTNSAAMTSGVELDVDALAARNFGRIRANCLTLPFCRTLSTVIQMNQPVIDRSFSLEQITAI